MVLAFIIVSCSNPQFFESKERQPSQIPTIPFELIVVTITDQSTLPFLRVRSHTRTFLYSNLLQMVPPWGHCPGLPFSKLEYLLPRHDRVRVHIHVPRVHVHGRVLCAPCARAHGRVRCVPYAHVRGRVLYAPCASAIDTT